MKNIFYILLTAILFICCGTTKHKAQSLYKLENDSISQTIHNESRIETIIDSSYKEKGKISVWEITFAKYSDDTIRAPTTIHIGGASISGNVAKIKKTDIEHDISKEQKKNTNEIQMNSNSNAIVLHKEERKIQDTYIKRTPIYWKIAMYSIASLILVLIAYSCRHYISRFILRIIQY